MSEPVDIPPRWRWATFGDVARVASDLVDPTLTPDAIHIAPNHIESGTGKLLPFATVATDKVTSPKHRFREGQLLYSKIRPYLAKVARATFCGVCSADMYPVDAQIDSGFLFHWLLSPWFTASASRNQGRTVLPKINQDALALLPVPIAPLPEQHRIVANIEELFSNLDAGVQSLKRAKANLKRYRASVLKAAVEGRLTEEWRAANPQEEDGQMLLDRILRERREKWEQDQLAKFREKGKEPPKNWQSKYDEPAEPDVGELQELPKGWVWATVEQVAHTATGGTPDRKNPDYFGGDIPWVKSGELGDGYVYEAEETLTALGVEESNAKLFPKGTLCIALYGATVGKLGILEMDATTNQAVCGIFLPAEVRRAYLFHYLTLIRPKLVEQGKGGAQSNISNGLVRVTIFPLPSLAEQDQIVSLIEERLSQIDAAEKTIDAELLRAKRLRQSILKQAFEGKLVPQDPNDEPASVLLERIKAARAAEPPNKRTKRSKKATAK